jgi:hypothetical protein
VKDLYFPENEPVRWSVLEACGAAFEIAYLRHLASSRNKFVAVVGKAEIIRLSESKQPYDILLSRPHITDSPSTGIEFWLSRIQNSSSRGQFVDYPELVALYNDPSQFYLQIYETHTPAPLGVDQSRELISYMHMADIIPLE